MFKKGKNARSRVMGKVPPTGQAAQCVIASAQTKPAKLFCMLKKEFGTWVMFPEPPPYATSDYLRVSLPQASSRPHALPVPSAPRLRAGNSRNGGAGCWASSRVADVGYRLRPEPVAHLRQVQARWVDWGTKRVVDPIRNMLPASWLGSADSSSDTANTPVRGSRRHLHQQLRAGNIPGHRPAGIPALTRAVCASVGIGDPRAASWELATVSQ